MPFKRSNYPDNWEEISLRIRTVRAGGQCEWHDYGIRCEAINHQPHPLTGSRVVLTVAHLNHDTTDNRDENLMAMCQLHHLRYDADLHARNSRRTRLLKKDSTRPLFATLSLPSA